AKFWIDFFDECRDLGSHRVNGWRQDDRRCHMANRTASGYDESIESSESLGTISSQIGELTFGGLAGQRYLRRPRLPHAQSHHTVLGGPHPGIEGALEVIATHVGVAPALILTRRTTLHLHRRLDKV